MELPYCFIAAISIGVVSAPLKHIQAKKRISHYAV